MPIGVAARGIDGTWRVKLFSDRGAIDFVRIMLFEDFGQLIGSNDLNAPPLAALDTLSEATPAQSTAIADSAARRNAAREVVREAAIEAAARPPATARPPAAVRPPAATPRPAAAPPPVAAPAADEVAPPTGGTE